MCKQYWADAATKNCVWLFQIKEKLYGEGGCRCQSPPAFARGLNREV